MKPLSEIYVRLFASAARPLHTVLVMHAKPDADAMGSALAAAMFLRKRGHEVVVISPTNWGKFLQWLPRMDEVVDMEKKMKYALEKMYNADLILALDFNVWHRTNALLAAKVGAMSATKLLIDHHENPDTVAFDYGYVHSGASSTCELVYDFIVDSGYRKDIDVDMATCLYAGMVADTGSFRYASVNANLHHKVADLLTCSIPHTQVHSRLFDTNTELKLRFLGHLLTNRLRVHEHLPIASLYITKDDIRAYKIMTGDTEGIVNYPMSLDGVQLVAMFSDRDKEIRCSFRSKTDRFDVNTFARKYFSGGGHKMAAGGHSYDSLDETLARFWCLMEREEIACLLR